MGTMGTASSGRSTNTGCSLEQIVVMVSLLPSVGSTDGIESSIGVGLADGITVVWSVGSGSDRMRFGWVPSRICVTLSFRAHPPGAEVFGRTTVRDASAIPCRGTRGVRAEHGVGTLLRYHQDSTW